MVNFWARWNVNGFRQGTIVVNGFSMVFFTSEPSLSMVFHISTIGINGFSNVFSLETMVFQWFFAVEPLVSMVFLPLNHWYQWFVQWLHKLIKKLGDIMKIIQVSPVSKVYPILSWTFISSSGWWAGLDPKHLPQELWHGFSASWESSICERKLHYPGNRTQNLLLSGEISYHTSVCWVKKKNLWPFATISK